MRFWKKENGDCGTVDDDGYVPDSVEISKSEYDQYVSGLPVVVPVEIIHEFEDVETGKVYRMREKTKEV